MVVELLDNALRRLQQAHNAVVGEGAQVRTKDVLG